MVRALVVLIFLLILLNPIVSIVDTTDIAATFALGLIFVSFKQGVNRHALNRGSVVLLYTSVLFLLIVIGALRTGELVDAVHYFIVLSLWPLFWIIIFSRYSPLILFSILPAIYFVIVVVVALSYFQYFLSPTLWGLINYNSYSLEWASATDFDTYIEYFRASSLLGSPQVLSAVCAMFTVLVVIDPSLRPQLKLIYAPLILGGGFLSGGKVVTLILLIAYVTFLVTRLLRRKVNKLRLFVSILIPVFIWSVYLALSERVPVVIRMSSLSAAIIQEQNDSRIDRFVMSFNEANPFFGFGYTHTMFADVTGFRAAESFISNLYFHTGILPTLLLIFLFYIVYTKSTGPYKDLIQMCAVLSFASLFVTTALESTAMYPIWGLIIAGFVSVPLQAKSLYGSG